MQSGVRKGKVISAAATKLERNRLWSWAHEKGVCGKRMHPLKELSSGDDAYFGWKSGRR